MGFTSPQEVWQRRLLEPWLRAGHRPRRARVFIDRDRVRAGFDDYLAGARGRPFLLVPAGVLRLVAGARAFMSPARRPLLLIAYKFPPYAGVGGFRWAKLSKYLARLGHEVHVVTVPWPAYGPNTLMADAAEPGVTVHPIPSGSPHRFRHRPLRGRWTVGGTLCRAAGARRALFYDDEAQRWGRHLVRLLRAADRRARASTSRWPPGIRFRPTAGRRELKRRRPGLKLIQDFRDPWADNPFRSLPRRRAQRIRAWQRDAVAAADAVVSVTPAPPRPVPARLPGQARRGDHERRRPRGEFGRRSRRLRPPTASLGSRTSGTSPTGGAGRSMRCFTLCASSDRRARRSRCSSWAPCSSRWAVPTPTWSRRGVLRSASPDEPGRGATAGGRERLRRAAQRARVSLRRVDEGLRVRASASAADLAQLRWLRGADRARSRFRPLRRPELSA